MPIAYFLIALQYGRFLCAIKKPQRNKQPRLWRYRTSFHDRMLFVNSFVSHTRIMIASQYPYRFHAWMATIWLSSFQITPLSASNTPLHRLSMSGRDCLYTLLSRSSAMRFFPHDFGCFQTNSTDTNSIPD